MAKSEGRHEMTLKNLVCQLKRVSEQDLAKGSWIKKEM
jgi:hypothetical protein